MRKPQDNIGDGNLTPLSGGQRICSLPHQKKGGTAYGSDRVCTEPPRRTAYAVFAEESTAFTEGRESQSKAPHPVHHTAIVWQQRVQAAGDAGRRRWQQDHRPERVHRGERVVRCGMHTPE